MQLLLIPVTRAAPALEAFLAARPDARVPLTPAELRILDRLAMYVFTTSELLVCYVLAVGGKPARN